MINCRIAKEKQRIDLKFKNIGALSETKKTHILSLKIIFISLRSHTKGMHYAITLHFNKVITLHFNNFIWCRERCLYNLLHLLIRVVHSVEDGRLFTRSLSNISVQALLTNGVFFGRYVRFQLMLVIDDGWWLIRSLSSIVVQVLLTSDIFFGQYVRF